MKNIARKQGSVAVLAEAAEDATPSLSVVSAAKQTPPAGMLAVTLLDLAPEERRVTIGIGQQQHTARLDSAVELAVVETALARGERVIAQHEHGAWVVLGALRTAATPGVDKGDDFVIEARRIALQGAHEIKLVSGKASLVMRARGYVETLSQHITTRAAQVQKIIGRVIHLN